MGWFELNNPATYTYPDGRTETFTPYAPAGARTPGPAAGGATIDPASGALIGPESSQNLLTGSTIWNPQMESMKAYMQARGYGNDWSRFDDADYARWLQTQPATAPFTQGTGGTPGGTPGRPPTGTTSTAPPGGYTESWFTQNFGTPKTPAELVALEPQLAAQGIKVRRNASGVAGDIELPGGQVVDIIGNAMQGGGSFHWLPDAPGGAGGPLNNYGAFQPYAGTFTGGGRYPLASVMGSGLLQPWTTPFTAPTDVTQQNDPGWQFRMKEGLNAIERSAASKGTLLTGGTMKDLNEWAQNTASNEYDKVYGRALGEYNTAYNIFANNQANSFGRLNALSQSGLTAAGGVNANNSGYAQGASNTIEGQGNVAAAGRLGSANAWANVPGQIAENVGSLATWWATRPRGTGYTGVVTGRNPGSDYGSTYPYVPGDEGAGWAPDPWT